MSGNAKVLFAEAGLETSFYALTIYEQLELELAEFESPDVEALLSLTHKTIDEYKKLIEEFKEEREKASHG